MTEHCNTSNALTLLFFLMGASFLHLSSPNLISTVVDAERLHKNPPCGQTALGDRERRHEVRQQILKDEAEENDLFEDVDPKTLAAVLLEALNHSQVERRKEGGKHYRMEEGGENKGEETDIRTIEEADQDRNGPQELNLLMVTQGNDKNIEDEDERKKAQKEEEMMTEKVSSHTTSQTVPLQIEYQLTSLGDNGNGAAPQKGPTSPEQGSNEEEEQLNPVELKSLETIMKEFPSLKTAKRDGDSKQNQGENRGFSNYNDIIPINEGSSLTMSKNKLKWQEETQKALNFPSFRGGNFMDDIGVSNYNRYAGQSQPIAEKTEMEDIEKEQKEKQDGEVLSPEEEEAQAKAEQDEMRRQAAEAQKAKIEEERLADIASDMLLLYMVKQNNGNKKYSSSLPSAVEDKRSNEVLEVTEEEDIDPQTIDKLIEISNKLHLPADDVVDIISDVEKKKKNVSSVMNSHWQKSTSLSTSLFSTSNGFSPSEILDNEKNYLFSNPRSSPVNRLRTWFREKAPAKSHDYWSKATNPVLGDPNLRAKPLKPLLIKPDHWLKSPTSVWTGYRSYPHTYPSLHQPYLDRYPTYFPPPPRPKFLYYIQKPAVNDIYTLPPKRRYKNWIQPWLRKPTVDLQQKPYFTSYPLSLYSWPYQPVFIPTSHSFSHLAVIPSQKKQFNYPLSAPKIKGNKDYYVPGKQTDGINHEVLEKYIEMISKQRPKMLN